MKILNNLIDQPVKLGHTDCNTIMCKVLDEKWGTNYHQRFTSNITKELIRSLRARDVLEDCGYKRVEDRPKKGDFIVVPAKFRDNVMYCYTPMRAITALKNELSKKNKVREIMIDEIDKTAIVYRKVGV